MSRRFMMLFYGLVFTVLTLLLFVPDADGAGPIRQVDAPAEWAFVEAFDGDPPAPPRMGSFFLPLILANAQYPGIDWAVAQAHSRDLK